MSTSYQIQELGNRLRIRSQKDMDMRSRCLVSVAVGGFAAVVIWTAFGSVWSVLVFVIVASLVFVIAKVNGASLEVTSKEFSSTGVKIGKRSVGPLLLCTADIQSIEYRSDSRTSQDDFDGLYAVTNANLHCVLPFLDFQQTQEVIEAIEKKFPVLAKEWHSAEPFGKKRSERSSVLRSLRNLF